MSSHKHLLFVTLLCAPLLAIAGDFFAVTPSGTPEMLFPGKALEVVGQLSSKCMDAHWKVINASGNEVVCEAPLSMGQSIMGQMLLGNSYSTPPRRFFRFNVVEIAGVSRVQASGWVETQMPFGQVKRVDFSGADFHNNVMGFMGAAGGKFPVGTTFPNHVVMGFQSERTQRGKYLALLVKEVTPNTPAFRAGLQSGDVIDRIAGRRFKDDQEYLEALAKAAKAPTYKIDVVRNDKSVELTLDRDFRPTFTEMVVAKPESMPQSTTAAQPTSVADELVKLSNLKDEGVLTQDEFEAQKAKLLAR
jgi:hypothetical protein